MDNQIIQCFSYTLEMKKNYFDSVYGSYNHDWKEKKLVHRIPSQGFGTNEVLLRDESCTI